MHAAGARSDIVAIQPPSAAAATAITQTPCPSRRDRDRGEAEREDEEEEPERVPLGEHPGQGYNPPRSLGA